MTVLKCLCHSVVYLLCRTRSYWSFSTDFNILSGLYIPNCVTNGTKILTNTLFLEIAACLVTDTISPLLLRNDSTGTGINVCYRTSSLLKGGTLDRPRHKKVSGMQTKEQLQQELKSKEAMINIMKV